MGLLSGGQRQAVSLLMATLAPMKILLLDEHTAALDPKTAEFVLDLTREIVAEQRLTTLMVTHTMRHALDCGEPHDHAARGPDLLRRRGRASAPGWTCPTWSRCSPRVRGQALARRRGCCWAEHGRRRHADRDVVGAAQHLDRADAGVREPRRAVVTDEPLYGHYLLHDRPRPSGARGGDRRPARGWREVAARLSGPVPDGRRVWYQKHMTHHLLPQIGRDWLSG